MHKDRFTKEMWSALASLNGFETLPTSVERLALLRAELKRRGIQEPTLTNLRMPTILDRMSAIQDVLLAEKTSSQEKKPAKQDIKPLCFSGMKRTERIKALKQSLFNNERSI